MLSGGSPPLDYHIYLVSPVSHLRRRHRISSLCLGLLDATAALSSVSPGISAAGAAPVFVDAHAFLSYPLLLGFCFLDRRHRLPFLSMAGADCLASQSVGLRAVPVSRHDGNAA